jgi:hypothetical protein
MDGFRSRFPTVTPWTTDRDLLDIVFRPCFTSVVSERGPACPSGAETRPAARPGRRPPTRRGPDPGRGGSGPGPAARSNASRVSAGHGHGGADGSARVQRARRTSTSGPRAGDHDPPRSSGGSPENRPRQFTVEGLEHRPIPTLISHIPPTSSDRAAGPATLRVTGTPGRQDGGRSRKGCVQKLRC